MSLSRPCLPVQALPPCRLNYDTYATTCASPLALALPIIYIIHMVYMVYILYIVYICILYRAYILYIIYTTFTIFRAFSSKGSTTGASRQ